VLVKSKDQHFEALNLALGIYDEKYVISKEDHIKKFDGLPTKRKLKVLTEERGLPVELYEKIWQAKQEFTFEMIKRNIHVDSKLVALFSKLKKSGFTIYVASNSIKHSVKLYLMRLGLMEFVDDYLSNEDVTNSKPNCEMYLKCMVKAKVEPKETIIVEDSPVGLLAATNAGANVFRVSGPSDLYDDKLFDFITGLGKKTMTNNTKWHNPKMNIVVPMAGAGSRFSTAGYTFPKPLIDIKNKPMIQVVVENLNLSANYIFIVRAEHYEKYNLKYLLNIIAPNCSIIQVNDITQGAACTVLLAKDLINNDEPLMIANSDQFVEWDSTDFLYAVESGSCDGGILVFNSTHPKWSYVKLNDEGYICDVQEKKVISNMATVGIYHFTKGSDFVQYAERMIEKDIRVNNEFYVAPVYNEAILDGKLIRPYQVKKMWGLGTPEDLQTFLRAHEEV